MILDDDYAPLTCEPFPGTFHELKVALIASRADLRGVTAGKLRVYHRGASLPEVDDEAVFLSSTRSLEPFESLRDIVGASRRALLLVTAALPPAGARACSSSAPTAPPPAHASLPSHALALPPLTRTGSGFDIKEAFEQLTLQLRADRRADRMASEWLIPPAVREIAPSVVFSIMKDGSPVGCGFFVSQTLAFTVSHNIHDNELGVVGISGRTLSGELFEFDVIEDLLAIDFMILEARSRAHVAHFTVTKLASCKQLLGNRNVALLGCGTAMSEETAREGCASTLDVSLTVVPTSVCHVGSTGNHFGYTATTYDGDSGACLFFSTDCCVLGIHQDGVNRAKTLVEQEESVEADAADLSSPSGSKRARHMQAVTASVKSIVDGMTTGGIALFLGSEAVQAAFERALKRGGDKQVGGGRGGAST